MDKALVSVIVPVYNVERYLKKCVQSIMKQTYKNLEIILIDDGSTDSSRQICDELENCDERIIVIHKKNGGLSDARNAGLDIASGAYYSFIDSESSLFYHPVNHEKVLFHEVRFDTLNQPSVCNKLFSSELFQNIRFPKGKYYEDTFIYHELLYRANNVVLTGTDSYWYLERSGSIVGSHEYTVRYFDFIEAIWTRAKFLIDNNVQPYGKEACLSLYAAFSNAEKYIKKSSENIEKFKIAQDQYGFAYKVLTKQNHNIGLKQKLRLIILKYFPILHSRIY